MGWEYYGTSGDGWDRDRNYQWVYYDQDGEPTKYATVMVRFMSDDFNPGSNPPGDAYIQEGRPYWM